MGKPGSSNDGGKAEADAAKARFQRARQPSIFRPPSTNPFSYDHKMTQGQLIKCYVNGLWLFPIRVILLVVIILITSLFAYLSVAGLTAKERERPLVAWRRALKQPVRLCLRAALFAMGFHWVRTKGRLASPKEAPLLTIAPHSSFVDFFFIAQAAGIPMAVSRRENADIPVIGQIIKASSPVFVSRNDPDSRRNCIREIERRVRTERGQWPHLMIFPEGTTTNRKCLITFKSGAFIPGVPVQPVCLKYPHTHFDPSWVEAGPTAKWSFFFMLTQFTNYMEVEYLPVYTPTVVEEKDYKLYALNVREQMSEALGVPVTSHTFDDVQLMQAARKQHIPVSEGAVEFGKITSKTGLSVTEAKALFDRFVQMQADDKSDGRVDVEQFARYLQVPVTPVVRSVFDQFDKDESGTIDFREYLIGLTLISRNTHTSDAVKLAFTVFDVDGDGLISKDELRQILSLAFPYISAQEVHSLFRRIDTNGDGVIQQSEFETFLETNPEYKQLVLAVRAQGKGMEYFRSNSQDGAAAAEADVTKQE